MGENLPKLFKGFKLLLLFMFVLAEVLKIFGNEYEELLDDYVPQPSYYTGFNGVILATSIAFFIFTFYC